MWNKKKALLTLSLGIVLLIIGGSLSFFINDDTVISRLFGVFFAFGAALIGGSIGGLYQIKRINNTPSKAKEIEIEFKDERNQHIREKANAKAGDISNWLVLLAAYICIVMDFPIWLVFLLLAIFLSKTILWIFFMKKYNNEF